MKFSTLLKLAAALAFSMLFMNVSHAHDYKIGEIGIDNPWMKAPPKGANVAGGYIKITNMGKQADRLLGGTSAIARKVEVHEMSMKNNIMMMRALPDGLIIKPGATVELKPGSFHFMFIGLKEQLNEGGKVKTELTFEKAGKVVVEFKIESITGKAKEMDHTTHRGSHSSH